MNKINNRVKKNKIFHYQTTNRMQAIQVPL